jgi:hypothetical protein
MSVPFSLDTPLDTILAEPELPLPVETILYCPLCRNEIDRHYPTNRGLIDVRYMIEAAEMRPCPICGRALHRSQEFTFDRVEVKPEERGYARCRKCGYLIRTCRAATASDSLLLDCITCKQIASIDEEIAEWSNFLVSLTSKPALVR